MTASHSSGPDGHEGRAEQSLYWIERLEEAPVTDEQDLIELTQWLLSSSDNFTCALNLLDLRAGLRAHDEARVEKGVETDLQHWIEVARLRAVDIEVCQPTPLEHSVWRPTVPACDGSGFCGWTFNWAVLGAICVLALCGVVFLIGYGGKEYSSREGNKRVVLWDRSVIELEPHSVADVRITNESRDVEIKNGGVDFEVASDPRPFNVRTSVATVTVTGTRFYVKLEGARARREAVVGVRSGAVSVNVPSSSSTAHSLQANQTARISADGMLKVMSVAAAEEPLSVFTNEPLPQVVQKFNERGLLPRVVVQGAACGVLMNGTWDIDQLLDVIGHHSELKVYGGERDEVVVVRGIDDSAATQGVNQRSDCGATAMPAARSMSADVIPAMTKTGAPAQSDGARQ